MDKLTAVVLGCARSGTSMTAGIVHNLGVNMNPPKDNNISIKNPKGCYEDMDIMPIIMGLAKKTTNMDDAIIRFKMEVTRKNKQDNWGFKTALTHHFIDQLLPYLRNPYLIFVTRNIKDNIFAHRCDWIRKNRNDLYLLYDIKMHEATDTLHDISLLYKVYCKYLNKLPTLIVHFDQLQHEALDTANKIAKFLEVEKVNENKIKDFIIPNHSCWKGV